MGKFSAETKARIKEAIAFFHANPGQKKSKIAIKFVVPYDLFYRRLNGRKDGKSKGGHNKALDETQDGALKRYINFLIYISKDPNLRTIQQAANSILRASGSDRILGRDCVTS